MQSWTIRGRSLQWDRPANAAVPQSPVVGAAVVGVLAVAVAAAVVVVVAVAVEHAIPRAGKDLFAAVAVGVVPAIVAVVAGVVVATTTTTATN